MSRLTSGLRNEPVMGVFARNLKWIFSSQMAVAVLGMVFLAIAARTLGAAGLGLLALVEAYARIVARLTHLEPWQAVIRYGSEALESEEPERFGRLIGMSVVLDLAGGLLAALTALILLPLLAPWLGLDGAQQWLLAAGALAIVFSLRATGISLLRLYDRFDLLAKIDAGVAAFRVGLAVLAWALGAGLVGFVAIFVTISLIDGLLAFLAGHRQMHAKGHQLQFGSLRQKIDENPGFLRLVWDSNLAVILRQTSQRLDVIILAALMPAAAVGYYHIARRCGDAALRLGRPLSQAIYPELARFAARGETVRLSRVVRGISLGFAAVLLVVLVPVIWYLAPIIKAVFGPDYLPAVTAVSIQTVAVGFYLSGIILNPALLSLGQGRGMVRIGALTATLFFVLFIPMVSVFGVAGASGTHLVCNLLWLGLATWLLRRSLQRATNKQESMQ